MGADLHHLVPILYSGMEERLLNQMHEWSLREVQVVGSPYSYWGRENIGQVDRTLVPHVPPNCRNDCGDVQKRQERLLETSRLFQ